MNFIAHPPSKFNTDRQRKAHNEGEALRRDFLHLGRELHSRGAYPTAQYFAELATLEPDLAHELLTRLRDYTRISVAEYMAVNADRFPSYLVPISGGQK